MALEQLLRYSCRLTNRPSLPTPSMAKNITNVQCGYTIITVDKQHNDQISSSPEQIQFWPMDAAKEASFFQSSTESRKSQIFNLTYNKSVYSILVCVNISKNRCQLRQEVSWTESHWDGHKAAQINLPQRFVSQVFNIFSTHSYGAFSSLCCLDLNRTFCLRVSHLIGEQFLVQHIFLSSAVKLQLNQARF